jgi:Ca2+-binding EF-hand superfamily protein
VVKLQTFGKKLTKDEIKKIMKIHDKGNKGCIDYQEFESMIMSS